MPEDAHTNPWLRRATFLAYLTSALVAAAVAQAIETTRFEVEFYAPGKEEPVNQATVWVAKSMLRIDQQARGASQPGPALIYRGDDSLVLSISHTKQSYVEVDRATIARVDEQARRIRHEFAGQLVGLPPSQRAQLERMLGISGTDPRQNTEPILVIPTEGGSKVAGFDCTNIVLERAGEPIANGCVAEWSRIGLAEKDLELFRTLANLQRDAMAARGFTPLELVPDQPFDLLTQLGGMPLFFERRSPTTGQISAIRVRSVKRERMVAGHFLAPSNYARRTGGRAMMEMLAESSSGPSTSESPASPAAPSGAPAPRSIP